jgi:hypothetical protein
MERFPDLLQRLNIYFLNIAQLLIVLESYLMELTNIFRITHGFQVSPFIMAIKRDTSEFVLQHVIRNYTSKLKQRSIYTDDQNINATSVRTEA